MTIKKEDETMNEEIIPEADDRLLQEMADEEAGHMEWWAALDFEEKRLNSVKSTEWRTVRFMGEKK